MMPSNEKGFKEWYAEEAKKNNLDPNPDHPLHYYDYRAAYKAGKSSGPKKHYPSKYKHDLHPNRYIKENGGWYDTKYEKPATAKDVYLQGLTRREHEKRMK